MEKISIIIPNFNNAKWLPRCIESCLQQEGSFQKEVIIVDDHSTDESWAILQEFKLTYPGEIFIYQNPTKGGNQARSFGFTKAAGDYIQWLDSDDVLLSGKLETQINFFKNNPEIDIVYSDWRMDFYKLGQKVNEEVKVEKSYNNYLTHLLQNKWQPNLSYLLRRKIALKLDCLNAWNPNTKVGQDREYFTLAAIIGANFEYVSGLFSVYNRWSKATVSNRMDDKKRSKEVIQLNNRFYREIVNKRINNKQKYLNVLNAELLRILFYHPDVEIKRRFNFWQIDPLRLHWKQRFILPYLYLLHLIRK